MSAAAFSTMETRTPPPDPRRNLLRTPAPLLGRGERHGAVRAPASRDAPEGGGGTGSEKGKKKTKKKEKMGEGRKEARKEKGSLYSPVSRTHDADAERRHAAVLGPVTSTASGPAPGACGRNGRQAARARGPESVLPPGRRHQRGDAPCARPGGVPLGAGNGSSFTSWEGGGGGGIEEGREGGGVRWQRGSAELALCATCPASQMDTG